MINRKMDDLISQARAINDDNDGFLLALSDLLNDCTDPLLQPNPDQAVAHFALERNSRAIEAVKEALVRNIRRQATVLARLERTNLKGGENNDSSN